MVKDYFNQEVLVGDYIVYGKHDRNHPLKVGTVVSIDEEEGYWGEITVLGEGNTKTGSLSLYNIQERIIKLPKTYNKKPL